MNKKFYFLYVLLVFVNFEWLFILSNYDTLKGLIEERKSITINKQSEYIDSIKSNSGVSIHLNSLNNDGFIANNSLVDNENSYLWGEFQPLKLVMPSINKEAPVYQVSTNYDYYLDRGVINLKVKNKKWYFIFGHSSSINRSPFQFIFTKITYMKEWDRISIEGDRGVKIYKYIDSFYKKPDKLDEINSTDEDLFLITCYPFNSDYTRYIVHFKLEDFYIRK